MAPGTSSVLPFGDFLFEKFAEFVDLGGHAVLEGHFVDPEAGLGVGPEAVPAALAVGGSRFGFVTGDHVAAGAAEGCP